MVIELSEGAFDDAISSGVALVDFWATWCQPCKMMGALLERQVEPQLEELGVTVGKVDVDENASLAERFDVQSIPTLIVFRDGRQVARLDGVQKPQDVVDAVRSALGRAS